MVRTQFGRRGDGRRRVGLGAVVQQPVDGSGGEATEGGGSGEGHEQGGATHRERFPWHQGPVVGIPMNLNESAVSGLTAGEVACGSLRRGLGHSR